jgi:protein-S-isoprenylcysteine O-methyltransferase Ste14
MDIQPALILVVGLPMLVVAGVVAAQAWRGQLRANVARDWPQTTGQVVWSGIYETKVREYRRVGVSRTRWATRYGPRVVYTYTIDGVRHQAERLQMGWALVFSEASGAEQTAARYPAGSQVTVYYNPANPAEATLDRRIGWGTRMLWLVALGVVLATIIILAFLIVSRPA